MRGGVAMTGVVLTLASATAAQMRDDVRVPMPDVRGPALVWAAYPELREMPLQWREAGPGVVTIAIRRTHGDVLVRSAPQEPRLSVTSEVDGTGALGWWSTRGPLTRDAQRAAILPVRPLGASAVASALRDARARFGPGQVRS